MEFTAIKLIIDNKEIIKDVVDAEERKARLKGGTMMFDCWKTA